jgi:hypothetical protein
MPILIAIAHTPDCTVSGNLRNPRHKGRFHPHRT